MSDYSVIGGVEWCRAHQGIADECGSGKYDDLGGSQCDMADPGDVCDIVPLYIEAAS